MFSVTQVKRPPTAEKIIKQTLFGVSVGINQTATEGRTAVIGATKQNFTVRGSWLERGPFTPKIDRSDVRRNNLTTVIKWGADWMFKHQTGGTKTGRGGHRIAVPGSDLGVGKRQIIPTSKRPKVLLGGKGAAVSAMRRGKLKGFKGKGAFIMETSKGPVIAMRTGRGKNAKLKFLYNLEGSVRIKKQPTFFPVIDKVVKRRLHKNVEMNITKALRTIK